MPISSSRQRLMPAAFEKPSAQSQPNLSIPKSHESIKKHARNAQRDKLTLPRINQLQIDDLVERQPHSKYPSFSSPFYKPSSPRHGGRSGTPSKKQAQTDPRREIAFKKIKVFSGPPELEPLTLVFSHSDESLSHQDVLHSIRKVGNVSTEDIRNIQFIHMNVVLGSAGVPSRWLIRVKGYEASQELLRAGLVIKGERINLRRCDDVNSEEYRAFVKRKTLLESDQHSEIQRLLVDNLS
ncbi:putative uncharacterized protein C19orf81-like [Holothuria leucospilota]|uniref:Uncharacterized protein n=1 Tax=Holothuria leucospilota TaxID=206669 RepID=A0A9Q1BRH8_HOLLE|nr:putative uncharacterized protein C19orf81-like [Holothuria leucospilota]